jgi:hypothetical protein
VRGAWALWLLRKSIQDGDSEDARWFLERSDPANWGRKDMLIQLHGSSTAETVEADADEPG